MTISYNSPKNYINKHIKIMKFKLSSERLNFMMRLSHTGVVVAGV